MGLHQDYQDPDAAPCCIYTQMGSVAKKCGKSVQSCIFVSMESKILEQLAQLVLPSEILERFEIVKIET
ncbi:MAG: hypothetical protein IJZ11_01110, partial [Bacteroidaceae bacterium]|nr:hypothetical protein [Bacteroidaceae bacterium]